ncbi:MAG: toll/interleukin-1 receptor domain-containing protein, partial [Gammaproteobacteria bacterium]|nr:toll/interleukin-1 receptor domain-containing protein [Gammaproteobacteria bacterium]
MLFNPKFRGSVFISYRRTDSPGYVRALMSDMRNTFGSKQVFLDMEDVAAGSDFRVIIEEAVSNCELLLAIIGPGWVTARDEMQQRRLDDRNDFVRLEIVSALARKIPVIPVLVGNAKMPTAEELPMDLQTLVTLQAVPLSHERWDDDIIRLFTAIERVTVEPRIARQYSTALQKLDQGFWQEALKELEIIDSVEPHYLGVPEKIRPLRDLAQDLSRIGPGVRGWHNQAAAHPLACMLLLSLLPNVLAALFNYNFNWEVIIRPMTMRGIDQAEHYFQVSAIVVNTSGFSLGTALFVYLANPVSRGMADFVNGVTLSPSRLAFLRERCLMLGQYIALISVCLWIIAGPVYPLAIGALEWRDYVYFITSLAICGVIAATYPFLSVTWVCTHVLYLAFIAPGSTQAENTALLNRIDAWKWRYLMLAGALPMLVVTLGLVLSPQVGSRTASILLGVLGFCGLAGFIVALWLF